MSTPEVPTPKDTPPWQLSAQTLTWLANRPHARRLVVSIWDELAELEQTGHLPDVLATVRAILIEHQILTRTGRCHGCRRGGRRSWRLWRRSFPCEIWTTVHFGLKGYSRDHPRQAPRVNKRPDDTRLGPSMLTKELVSRLGPWRRPLAMHDPGKVVLDVAVVVALGGDAACELGVLRAQPGLFGLHPLLGFVDHGSGGTGEPVAELLRPGNAGPPMLRALLIGYMLGTQ